MNWKCVLGDYGKAFIACIITAFLMLNKPFFNLGLDDWKAVGSAAIASFLPIVLSALNKKDTRYGRGSHKVSG